MVIITLLQPLQRTVLIRLGKSFSKICARVVDKAKLEALGLCIVETILVYDVCFSSAFFGIMQHTLVHLVNEMAVCGPVGDKWMYPCERYLEI